MTVLSEFFFKKGAFGSAKALCSLQAIWGRNSRSTRIYDASRWFLEAACENI